MESLTTLGQRQRWAEGHYMGHPAPGRPGGPMLAGLMGYRRNRIPISKVSARMSWQRTTVPITRVGAPLRLGK